MYAEPVTLAVSRILSPGTIKKISSSLSSNDFLFFLVTAILLLHYNFFNKNFLFIIQFYKINSFQLFGKIYLF